MFAMFAAASDVGVGVGGVTGATVIYFVVKNAKTLGDGARFFSDARNAHAESKQRAAVQKIQEDQAAAFVHSLLAAAEKKPVAKKKAVKKTAKRVAPAPVRGKKAAANPAP